MWLAEWKWLSFLGNEMCLLCTAHGPSDFCCLLFVCFCLNVQAPRYLNKPISAYNMKEKSYKVMLRDERVPEKQPAAGSSIETKDGKEAGIYLSGRP